MREFFPSRGVLFQLRVGHPGLDLRALQLHESMGRVDGRELVWSANGGVV